MDQTAKPSSAYQRGSHCSINSDARPSRPDPCAWWPSLKGAGPRMSHTSEPFTVKTRADLARAIAVTEAAGGIGLAHLLRALRQGRVVFLPTLPDTSTTRFMDWTRKTAGQAAIVLIGDDDGMNRTPMGWPIAGRAVTWARS